LEAAVFLEGKLAVHEQAETFFEGEVVEIRLLELFFKPEFPLKKGIELEISY
jgi:hypothetical protein